MQCDALVTDQHSSSIEILLPALGFGVVSLAAPFFILQPGMGAGIAAAKTPNPNLARFRSLVAHASFAIGLYLAATLFAWLF